MLSWEPSFPGNNCSVILGATVTLSWERLFLCPVNLIRGVVEGGGFVGPVQALVFLEMFLA